MHVFYSPPPLGYSEADESVPSSSCCDGWNGSDPADWHGRRGNGSGRSQHDEDYGWINDQRCYGWHWPVYTSISAGVPRSRPAGDYATSLSPPTDETNASSAISPSISAQYHRRRTTATGACYDGQSTAGFSPSSTTAAAAPWLNPIPTTSEHGTTATTAYSTSSAGWAGSAVVHGIGGSPPAPSSVKYIISDAPRWAPNALSTSFPIRSSSVESANSTALSFGFTLSC